MGKGFVNLVIKDLQILVILFLILIFILEKNSICKDCGKEFAHSDTLSSHYHIHTGERPNICKDCGKGFITSTALNQPSRTHTGEKHFICKDCGKGFIASSKLTQHSRIHTSKRKCFICKGKLLLVLVVFVLLIILILERDSMYVRTVRKVFLPLIILLDILLSIIRFTN